MLYTIHMRTVNALSLRQSLGKILKQLEKGDSPIFVERNREKVAVLISIRDFSERFADREAMAERQNLVQEIHAFRKSQKPVSPDTVSLLKELRGSR
jgi:PHD/YefM family antitoxin component YafN of YafNO toxin-antitoxin module